MTTTPPPPDSTPGTPSGSVPGTAQTEACQAPAEQRIGIHFSEKDTALREDVRRLGKLVGELVREQAGEALYDLVEAARRASIAHREGNDDEAFARLENLLGALEPRAARDFIRGFSTYFQVVNMAEKVHRIRRRRAYAKDAIKPQPFCFRDVLKQLKAEGIEPAAMEASIARLHIEPVFTAHLTEVTRRTLLRKQQAVAQHLLHMLDPYLTPDEVRAELRQIRLEMTTGWQTEEFPGKRPQLGDEAEHVLFFLTDVLYGVLPEFYENFERALTEVFSETGTRLRVPKILQFASWVGGDMDANPNVTAKSMRQMLARQRSLVLDRYYQDCEDLAHHLSQGDRRASVSTELSEQAALYARHFPQAYHSVPSRHRTMPYRVFLRLVCARLQSTYDDDIFPYESPEEFAADIKLVADSLRTNKGRHAGLLPVQQLLRRIETFGFHLATLDVRQNALVHRRVIGELLEEPQWLDFSRETRTRRLTEILASRESPQGALTSEARRTLAVFQAIAYCRRKYGRGAIGQYIVSMAGGPDDVLSAILLARWGDLAPKGGAAPIDIVPLFETIDDVEQAGDIMEALLANDQYRRHLKARDNEQMVMIGYSDSNKDNGFVSARWSLYRAQRSLVATMRQQDVELTLFHGRGGTISRSGGRLNEGLLAVPDGAISGRLRMTEQGEMLNEKYGLKGIALRSLEQTVSSVLWLASHEPETDGHIDAWRDVMERLQAESAVTYKKLVYGSEDFERYFESATPIDVVERLSMGLSSVARTEGGKIEDLRPLPWIFAWTQSRCMLPGWFGFASGFAKAAGEYGHETLREMFRSWPFFRVLVKDVEVALAKADLAIACRYSILAGPLHERYFPNIQTEYDRCVEVVLGLTGGSRLLAKDDTLRRSIRLRNPYMDPMNLLQVDLLKRWREGGRQKDDALAQALKVSINGIAHGMQTTG